MVPLIGKKVLVHKTPWNANGGPTRYIFDGRDALIRIVRPDDTVLDLEDRDTVKTNLEVARSERKEVRMLRTTDKKAVRTELRWTCLDESCLDYGFNATVDDGTRLLVSSDVTVESDVVTRDTIRVADFVYEHSR